MAEQIIANLRNQWEELKAEQPHIRIRNAAAALGVSEAELLCTLCGESVTRLRPEINEILGDLNTLGYVMALTRNNEVVHERKGVYPTPQFHGKTGLFVSADIDLRLFLTHWEHVFAVIEMMKDIPRYSIQFFAKDGEAIHKIYLVEESNFTAYQNLVQKFRSENQSTEITVTEIENKTEARKPVADDVIALFKEGWLNLKDTHDFFILMKRSGLTRMQALEHAPSEMYAKKLPDSTFRNTLFEVANKAIPVMIFVGNVNMIQIHTGMVHQIVDREGWLNVLDPDFNLHVKEDEIRSVWLVRKPSIDGIITSLEIFNSKEELIVQMFGKRKPGIPELPEWTSLTERLWQSANEKGEV